MLGGLLRTRHTESKDEFPILSKVPVLGWLFRNKKSNDIQRELLIFITPSIVFDNGLLAGDKAMPMDMQGREVAGPDRVSAITSDLDSAGAARKAAKEK
jgi:type II secretory pathway component GspD/PulD (secretin)